MILKFQIISTKSAITLLFDPDSDTHTDTDLSHCELPQSSEPIGAYL